MKLHRLHDEAPSLQDQQCAALGADLYVTDEDYEGLDEFGADPFDIIAARQERGEFNDD